MDSAGSVNLQNFEKFKLVLTNMKYECPYLCLS